MVPAVWFYSFIGFTLLFESVFSTSSIIGNVTLGDGRRYFGGTIRRSARSGKLYYEFLGIPYAKPPIGSLRFQTPLPLDPWDGVKDCYNEGPVCPQLDEAGIFIGDENCLFLNVYTRELEYENLRSVLKPVMVWIHGGSLVTGAGHIITGHPDFLVDEDVIVVTFNYRLGILGFVNLNKKEISGNAGLKDQVLALKWVHDNIGIFGGDPRRVTIFGGGSGSVCVHYHVLSPLSKGLFHSAISQSGTALNQWGYQSKNSSINYGYSLATHFGVNLEEKTESVVKKFSTVTAEQLVRYHKQEEHKHASRFELKLGPTTDSAAEENAFLPDTPINIIENGGFNNVPYIVGSNSAEGIAVSNWLKKSYNFLSSPDFFIRQLFQFYMGHDIPVDGINKIKAKYVNKNEISEYVNLFSDIFFVNGIYCTASKHSKANQMIFVYKLTHNNFNSTIKKKYYSEEIPGVPHGEEVIYLFNTDDREDVMNYNTTEGILSTRMAALWANFAKTNDPTPIPDPRLSVNWKHVNKLHFPYLDINTELSLKYDFHKDRVNFWDKFYEQYAPGKPICWKHYLRT